MKGWIEIDWSGKEFIGIDGILKYKDKVYGNILEMLKMWEIKQPKVFKENVSEKAKLMYALLK